VGERKMRKRFNIFVDPRTQRPLRLKIEREKKGHIISGKLYNENSEYPIIRGIPRFVDEEFYNETTSFSKEKQCAKSFGYKWREKRSQRLGSTKQDVKGFKEKFMAMLGCNSISRLKDILKKSKKTLNAGCGIAWPEYLFNYNQETERHCIDISLSVETAYNNTKKLKNVIISQASIYELPYQDEIFDVIYSLGVLHHTPDPKKAFLSLMKKLRRGGLIGVYIYNKKPFLREVADKEIRDITKNLGYEECMKFSKKITKFGKALSRIKQPLMVEEDIDLLGIKKGKYNIHRLMYDFFIKCWYNPKMDTKYADLVNQDWYHPYYASHHTKEEIISWFKETGIEDIICIQPKGWEYSGYFVSGRKR